MPDHPRKLDRPSVYFDYNIYAHAFKPSSTLRTWIDG